MINRHNLLSGLHFYTDKFSLFSRNAKMVLLYSGLTGLVFGVFRLVFSFYVLSLGYNERLVGDLTSYTSLAAFLVALPAVYLSDRFSQKHIMLATSLLITTALVGLVIFPSAPFLIAFSMLIGLSQAVRQIAVAPFLMSNTTPDERQYVFSFNFGMMTLTSAIGQQLGGLLPGWLGAAVGADPQSATAYQLALIAMTVISLIAVSPLPFIRIARVVRDQKIEMPWKKLFRHGPQLVKFITPQLIIGLGAGMMMPFINIYFRKVFGLGDAAVGTIAFAAVFGMGIAQFIAPIMADRMGKMKVVMLTQALSIPFLMTLGLAAWLVPSGQVSVGLWIGITSVAYFLRMALMNFSGPIYETFILEHAKPEATSLASALNGLSFQFGWIVSPTISGWFQTTYGEFGFVPVFASVSVLYALAIFVEWLFFHKVGRAADFTQATAVVMIGDEGLEPEFSEAQRAATK
jgi:MFS family permease